MKSSFEIAQQIEKKIGFLRLEKRNVNGIFVRFIGTGFIIDKKYLITNFHLIKIARENSDSTLIYGYYESKDSNTGVVKYKSLHIDLNKVTEDAENDIAIFTLENKLQDENSFQKKDLVDKGLSNDFKLGDEAVYSGFPLATEFIQIGIGLTLLVNKCVVAALKYNAQKKDIHFLLIDSHVNPSSSGSPLISLSNEKILGIVSGTFHQSFVSSTASENKPPGLIQIPRNIGLVRPANYIFKLIDKVETENKK